MSLLCLVHNAGTSALNPTQLQESTSRVVGGWPMSTILRKKHIKVLMPNEGQMGLSFVVDWRDRKVWLGLLFIVVVIGSRV